MIQTVSQLISPKYFFKKSLRPNSYKTKLEYQNTYKKPGKDAKQN